MNWDKIAVFVVIGISFYFGYATREEKANADIAEIKRASAVARANQGKESYAKLVAAVDAATAARTELDRAQSELVRVRKSIDDRLRRTKGSSRDSHCPELAACTDLLRESVDLLSEPKSRSKPSRYSSENDVLIEKSVKYTDFFLLSIVYV